MKLQLEILEGLGTTKLKSILVSQKQLLEFKCISEKDFQNAKDMIIPILVKRNVIK